MNTYFYTESHVFETREAAQAWLGNIPGRIDEVRTGKSYSECEGAYEEARKDGNSSADSIEWAK